MSDETEQQAIEIEKYAADSIDFEKVSAEDIAAENKNNEPTTAEILQPILMMGFGVIAPNWNVSEDEAAQLADIYSQLVDKYFPDGVGNYGVEISAIMVTGAIVLPRLKTPRKAEPKKEEELINGN